MRQKDQGRRTTGDVAQLGEHLLCKQGVVGSIPIVSTSSVLRYLGFVAEKKIEIGAFGLARRGLGGCSVGASLMGSVV